MNLDILANHLHGIAITETSRLNREHGPTTQVLANHPCTIAADFLKHLNDKVVTVESAVVEVGRGESRHKAVLRLVKEAQVARGVFREQIKLDLEENV
jgi:hypothetical protein